MKHVAFGAQILGKRKRQEDRFAIDLDAGIFVVADGMGGHADGDTAAQISCDVIMRELKAGVSMTEAFDRANTAVREFAENAGHPYHGTPAAVAVALRWMSGYNYQWGCAGDARIYTCDGTSMTQITTDHEDPWGAVTRYIGNRRMHCVPDVAPILMTPNSRFLLASDGLWSRGGHVSVRDIETILKRPCTAALAVEDLLTIDSDDNSTCVVVDVKELF